MSAIDTATGPAAAVLALSVGVKLSAVDLRIAHGADLTARPR